MSWRPWFPRRAARKAAPVGARRRRLLAERLEDRNMLTGMVAGVKWNDLDNDGLRDAGEPGLGGVQIYADTNTNSRFDQGEPAMFSGPDGEYQLTLSPPGEYTVRETVPSGWVQTSPAIGSHTVTVLNGGTVADCDFGNHFPTAAVTGVKWNDADHDGVRDVGESGLGGVQIYVDADNNGQFDAGETGVFTATNGSYRLTLAPGTYIIRETVETSWVQTTPAAGFYEVRLADGDTAAGYDFGNWQGGAVTGLKWEDLDHDGQRDDGESGLGGVQIYADIDANQRCDAGEPAVFTAPDGSYRLLLTDGTYIIRETVDADWVQTAPRDGRYEVDIGDGETVTGCDFGNWWGASIAGSKWNDLDNDSERDAGEPGLGGVQIYADLDGNAQCDAGEPAVFTAPDGSYRLLLAPATYTIRETLHENWVCTSPAEGLHTVDLPVGTTAIGIDFGNHLSLGTVTGTKWEDLDHDGLFDSGEAGLGGVQIYVDADNNGRCDAGETATFTAPDGTYQLQLAPGTYILRETNEVHYVQTAPTAGFYQVAVVDGGTSSGWNFGNWRGGAVTGVKWEDLDGDSVHDAGEAGLGGVQIYADINDNGLCGTGEPAVFTAPDGSYRLLLDDGIYVIRETVPPGWTQKAPVEGFYEAEVVDGGTVTGCDFGNALLGAVTGTKWSDLDRDGQRDAGEAGLGGVQIYADINGNQRCDAGEPAVFTGPDGSYRLVLDIGAYTIRETLPTDSVQTAPVAALYSVRVTNGATVTDCDFGNHLLAATLSGVKWDDLNHDGELDPGEPGLGGFQICVDADNNGLCDAGETAVFTAPDGSYQFTLAPGTYILRETNEEHWVQTSPAEGFYQVEVADGDTVDGLDFGNWTAGVVTGVKWEDLDHDGAHDPGEAGLGGWQIYADMNDNGLCDTGEPAVFTAPDGKYRLLLDDGTYSIRETLISGWVQSAPTLGYYAETIADGATLTGRDFGNYPTLGTVTGVKWNDLNANGQRDPEEPGLGGVQIYVDADNNGLCDAGETSVFTAPDGSYQLTLDAGNYILRETVPNGWLQTAPGSGFYAIGLDPGETVSGCDFGNVDGLVTGTVWNDANGDGLRDAGEPGLAGWQVYADTNQNGQFDAGEPNASSATDGSYALVLADGHYVLRETVAAGWLQTAPVGGSYALTVVMGVTLSDRDFGNRAVTESYGVAAAGLYDPDAAVWYLSDSNSGGAADNVFGYGQPGAGWVPVAGDWDGLGGDSIGLYDPDHSLWYLRNTNSAGQADYLFGYGPGQSDWIPVVGDWDGNGTRTVGLYDPVASTWYLRNSNTAGSAQIVFGFGLPGAGWIPVVGDWNGDGIDTVGLYDPAASTWYLSNTNATAAPDALFGYGQPGGGWTPVAGNWDATAGDGIGLVDQQCVWSLRNANTSGMADTVFGYGPGGAGWIALAGDWSTPEGAALMAAQPGAGLGATTLDADQLRPIVDEALRRYAAAGLSTRLLADLTAARLLVADLPGTRLGWASNGAITIDVDAAGHGWFVDATPASDEEFANLSGSVQALDPAAVDRIDLLTVVAHELGHLAGLEDVASGDDLMSASLPVSLRRTMP